MPRILWGKSFSRENVPQVTSTVIAKNFNATAIGIGNLFYGIGKSIVEGRPAAAGIEFVGAFV